MKHVCVIILSAIVWGGGVGSACADIVIKGNPKKPQPSQQSSVQQPKKKVATTETSNVIHSSARVFVDCQAIVRAGQMAMSNHVDRQVYTICVRHFHHLLEHQDK